MEYKKKTKAPASSVLKPVTSGLALALTPAQRAAKAAEQETTLQRQKEWRAAHDLLNFTSKTVNVQRQVAGPALHAASLYRQEVQQVEGARPALQRQVADLQQTYSAATVQAAVQRQQERYAPAPIIRHPQSNADWVTVMRQQAEQADGRRMLSREYNQFSALQRQVAQRLAAGYRQDRQAAAVRNAEYAGHLVALQRHPISGQVAQVVMGLVPQGDRPLLQRAVDETLQREAQQQAQDAPALHLHALQRQLAELDEQASQPVLQRIQARRGAGNPLPAAVQRHLEQGLNHDLSGVRIHDDAEADKLSKSVNAVAFTTGTDIYFRSGKFNPNTQSGLELLAHEVTHTVQQSKGQVGKGIDPDAGLENEARTMGARLARYSPAITRLAPPSSRTASLGRSALQRKAAPTTSKGVGIQEVVQALWQYATMSQNASTKQTLQTALQTKKGDGDFWHQIVVQGSARHGQTFMQQVLTIVPNEFLAPLKLAALGGEQELTHAALMNQMAFMAYSNAADLRDTKNMPADPKEAKPGGNARAILQKAGYTPLPTIQGLWGFQMRVFQPLKGSKNKTVVAFRGTEGLNPNPNSKPPVTSDAKSQKDNESGLDTMVDLAAYATAYSQFEVNQKAIIDPLFKKLGGNLIATGHSLGGGLAQIAVAKYPNLFSEVYTFQGASIKKSDVDKLDQQNKTLKARHFRAGGDVVPSSGEAAIKGQVFDIERHAGLRGNPLNTLNATGGHNTPPALDMLRGFNQAGLLSKSNGLAQLLSNTGSRDPQELAGGQVGTSLQSTYGTAQDTFPGKEELKQGVTGEVFLPAFISTYQNNAVYNILMEQATPRLQNLKPQGDPSKIIQALQNTAKDVSNKPLHPTASSLKMLDVIMQRPMKEIKAAISRGELSPQVLNAVQQNFNDLKNLKIDPIVIEENKQRFRHDILMYWYALHPGSIDLFQELKKQW